jgi:hypothetical protein
MEKRLVVYVLFAVPLTVLCLLGIRYYLRLPPHPDTRFKLNKGLVFSGDCGRVSFALENGAEKAGYQCDWRLLTDSYFETIGDPVRVDGWCSNQGGVTLTGDWDIDWRYFRFNASHSVPAWWDGCPHEVVIETMLHLQLNLE